MMKILIDGVFFQIQRNSGIARVWYSLLTEWSQEDFSQSILVLDRGGTTPPIKGISTRLIPSFDYHKMAEDRQLLQQICDEERASLFLSTYYTTPLTTPSVLMIYDMIPEGMGANLNYAMWQQKHQAIRQAFSYLVISQNTAQDLMKFFPQISASSIVVTPCGVSDLFAPATTEEISQFQKQYHITKPYFLIVGDRFGFNGYKNTLFFFQAFSKFFSKAGFDIVCVGGGASLEPSLKAYTENINVHILSLKDPELKAAYSGAIALIFPSKYEGFGLPILEAMTCGCPVITCPNSAIPEVAGEAALYVNDQDINGLINALLEVQKPIIRDSLIRAGLGQAKKFSWKKTAQIIKESLRSEITETPTQIPENTITLSVDEIKETIKQYKENYSANVLQKLRLFRQQIAEICWEIPSVEKLVHAYSSQFGKLHQALMYSGLKDETLTPDEKNFIQKLSPIISQGLDQPKAFNALLAAMLYRRADQLEIAYKNAPIPNSLLDEYVKFMFATPSWYQEKGEAENYVRYWREWLNYIHLKIFQNQDSSLWQNVAYFFSVTSNFIPIYFTTEDIKDLYIKRAEIMEFSLRNKGFQLDYQFSERPPSRQKIRLGILNEHFNPQTETFGTLPVFEHLDRDKFEIILYANTVNHHSLEKYCESRVDRLIQLPEDIHAKIHQMRNDDLDILWIGTNITAVYKPSTILALHRLARIQVTSFCSPNTTGMRHIDYYIGGSLTTPLPDYQQQYSEKLVTIDGCGFTFHYPPDSQQVTVKITRQNLGISSEQIVFISGANFYKILPELRETWAKILAKVPNSVLILYPFGPAWSRNYPADPFVNNFQEILKGYKIEINRVKFVKQLPSRLDVKELLKLGDIYLDSYPYAGATSLIDPLEMGLPTVVMEGNALRFRQGSALLRSLSIHDLIVHDEISYVELAVKLSHSQYRQQKRQEIVQKMQNNPPFLDRISYSKKITEVFQTLFQQWEKSQQPQRTYPSVKTEDSSILTPHQILGLLNLYQIDPSAQSVLEQLRIVRRNVANFWLTIPSENLEIVYQDEIGKAYQALLKSGIQNESMTDEEQSFLYQLAQVTKGLIYPQAINALLGAMLYFPPGSMRIPNAQNRLPKWLITDYQIVFENHNNPGESLSTYELQGQYLSSPQFLNQLLGTLKLYHIDSSDQLVEMELRQFRKQMADFWVCVPDDPQKLASFYQGDLQKAYQSLLTCNLSQKTMLDTEKTFFNSLVTEVIKGMKNPKAVNHLLAILLYCQPGQLQVEDPANSLPQWLLTDYQNYITMNA